MLRVVQRSGKYFLKGRFGGTQITRLVRRPDGKPETRLAAVNLECTRANEAITKGEAPFATGPLLSRFVLEYLAFWAPPRNAQGTIDHKTDRLNRWLKWHRENYPASVSVADVERAELEAWQQYRGTEASPVTANVDLAYVKHLFAWAEDRGYVSRSPAARLKRLPTRAKPIRTVPEATIAKIAAAMPAGVRAAWVFCAETGVRPGEMFALEWGHLDMRARTATFTAPKTGKTKTVRFSEATKRNLTGLAPSPRLVFLSPDGQPWERFSWRRAVHRACDAAKVPRVNPYALRHTVATRLFELGEDAPTIRDLMGHSTLAVTNIYAHSTQDRINAALDRLQKGARGTKRGTG